MSTSSCNITGKKRVLILSSTFGIRIPPKPKTNWYFSVMIKNNYHEVNVLNWNRHHILKYKPHHPPPPTHTHKKRRREKCINIRRKAYKHWFGHFYLNIINFNMYIIYENVNFIILTFWYARLPSMFFNVIFFYCHFSIDNIASLVNLLVI